MPKLFLATIVLLVSCLGGAQTAAKQDGPSPTPEVMTQISAISSLVPKDQLPALAKLLARTRQIKDRDGEAVTLFVTGIANDRLGDPKAAEQALSASLVILRELKDFTMQGLALMALGKAVDEQYRKPEALADLKQAIKIEHDLKDKQQEMEALGEAGALAYETGDEVAALDLYTQAAEIAPDVHAVADGASFLNKIGGIQTDLGDFKDAKDMLDIALEIRRNQGDKAGQAAVLDSFGNLACAQGESNKGLEFYAQALLLSREAKDRKLEAVTLGSTGRAYADLSQWANALDYYGRALQIQTDDRLIQNESTTRFNLADAYGHLGQLDLAQASIGRALELDKLLGDKAGEGKDVHEQANIIYHEGNAEKARDTYQQALALSEAAGDSRQVGATESDLGLLCMEMEQPSQAIVFFQRALDLTDPAGNKSGEAATLDNLAGAKLILGNAQDALPLYMRALVIEREIGDRDHESKTLTHLEQLHADAGRDGIAILFGKLAVNVVQSIRKDVSGAGKEALAGYTEEVGYAYSSLARLLARQGRFGEAEEVLGLLKDEEYFKFLQTRAAATSQSVDLTDLEKTWVAKYDTVFKDFGALGQEFDALAKIALSKLTADQKARMKAINGQFQAQNKAVNEYFESAQTAFSTANAATERLTDLQAATGLSDTLKMLPDNPTAIYTMITKDGVHLLVNLPNGSVLREPAMNIKADTLCLKVLAFRQALQDPRVDPRPLGAELYELLVRPIEPDLEKGKVGTIMWSLDSWLRYIPMWALYDAKAGKYLIEKYPSSLFTPRTLDKQTREVHPSDWTGAEFGVSLARTVGSLTFPSLPGVPNELKTVAGQVGGVPKIDAAFTKDAFEEALGLKPKVVHIATHFNFIPGDDKDSFLLLGDGALSVEDFKALRNGELNGVELLVLSACNTAGGDTKSDGGEFESFALLAQLKGADSVMATLWPVSDASTALLMGEFYKLRKSHPEWTKLEALRQAQLEMIRGTLTGDADASRGGGLQTKSDGQPAWTGKGFSHPFYWAPFELVGNWK